jgi:predicted oxidoreductase (fatty acid repression mutant protein)
MTVLDHLISAFQKSAIYNRHDLTRPSMILRTDSERLWEKVAPTIAQVVTAHDFSLRREERIESILVKRFFSSLIFSSKVAGCF